MNKAIPLALAALFIASPVVLALATETFGNAPVSKQPEWADGVVDAINLKSRVYAHWVNGNETFYYHGGARELNAALAQFAKVKDEVRQVILLPGAGRTQTFGKKQIDFAWQLHVPSGIYRAVSGRKHAVMTVHINAKKPRPVRDAKAVEKWLRDLGSDVFATRDNARKKLEKLGPDAKPFLQKALKGPQVIETRRRIQGILEKLPDIDVTDLEIPKGVAIVTVDDLLALYLKGVKDADGTRCGLAVGDLSNLVDYSDRVVPELTKMLAKDKAPYPRQMAAFCLAHIGVRAKPALPALKEAAKDAKAPLRKIFEDAAAKIENAQAGPNDAKVLARRLAIREEIAQFKQNAAKRSR